MPECGPGYGAEELCFLQVLPGDCTPAEEECDDGPPRDDPDALPPLPRTSSYCSTIAGPSGGPRPSPKPGVASLLVHRALSPSDALHVHSYAKGDYSMAAAPSREDRAALGLDGTLSDGEKVSVWPTIRVLPLCTACACHQRCVTMAPALLSYKLICFGTRYELCPTCKWKPGP